MHHPRVCTFLLTVLALPLTLALPQAAAANGKAFAHYHANQGRKRLTNNVRRAKNLEHIDSRFRSQIPKQRSIAQPVEPGPGQPGKPGVGGPGVETPGSVNVLPETRWQAWRTRLRGRTGIWAKLLEVPQLQKMVTPPVLTDLNETIGLAGWGRIGASTAWGGTLIGILESARGLFTGDFSNVGLYTALGAMGVGAGVAQLTESAVVKKRHAASDKLLHRIMSSPSQFGLTFTASEARIFDKMVAEAMERRWAE